MAPRKSRRRRLAVAVAVAGVASLASLGLPANADMVGFTGDLYFCDHQLTQPHTSCFTPSTHSYGFASATYQGSGNISVCAHIAHGGGGSGPVVCGTNLARVCLQGAYPNCTDVDGGLWTADVFNGSGNAHTIVGHALY